MLVVTHSFYYRRQFDGSRSKEGLAHKDVTQESTWGADGGGMGMFDPTRNLRRASYAPHAALHEARVRLQVLAAGMRCDARLRNLKSEADRYKKRKKS